MKAEKDFELSVVQLYVGSAPEETRNTCWTTLLLLLLLRRRRRWWC